MEGHETEYNGVQDIKPSSFREGYHIVFKSSKPFPESAPIQLSVGPNVKLYFYCIY